jgi:predicted O-methyltransferase YrrM
MRVDPIHAITHRIRRRTRHVREWYTGVRDARGLPQAFPQLASYPKKLERSRCALEPYYREYVTTVSAPIMAISLELAAFLNVLCETQAPTRVLDLGSGFSSFVLRRYAGQAGPAVEVHSADHAAEWLAATGRYLERHGLAPSGLSTWDEFRSREHAPFGLILHDLGGPVDDHLAYRLSVLPEVLDLLAPGGVIVLDDANNLALGPAARRLFAARNCRCWSLKQLVQDGFGRWALMAQR